MPQAVSRAHATRAVVFSPLDGGARAARVEQRLSDAILTGLLRDGEKLPSESQLAASLGVAVVTAREALEALRGRGLVRTRRGRDGGSFVTFDAAAAARMTAERLRASSRIELRDLALHYAAIAGAAADAAAERASADDLESLRHIDENSDDASEAPARRALARFQLEVAATSQSTRLVREHLRLQAQAGPLLWLCLREQAYRDGTRHFRRSLIEAVAQVDGAAARSLMTRHIEQAVEFLIDEKGRLEFGGERADEDGRGA